MEDAKCTAAYWNVGPMQASNTAVTASTAGANIAYWSLLRGKRGPPTEAVRLVKNSPPRTARGIHERDGTAWFTRLLVFETGKTVPPPRLVG